jgi:hypothetical protein
MLIFTERGKPAENPEKNPRGKGENNTSNKLNSHMSRTGIEMVCRLFNSSNSKLFCYFSADTSMGRYHRETHQSSKLPRDMNIQSKTVLRVIGVLIYICFFSL